LNSGLRPGGFHNQIKSKRESFKEEIDLFFFHDYEIMTNFNHFIQSEMPLTPSTTSATTSTVDATKATLLELFAELSNVSSDAETDATSLLRRNELVALVATRLTSDDALSALESDASIHPSQRIDHSSIVSSVIQAISPRTPTPLRLIALDQLAIFFS
jgi:hypothetical protein